MAAMKLTVRLESNIGPHALYDWLLELLREFTVSELGRSHSYSLTLSHKHGMAWVRIYVPIKTDEYTSIIDS